MARAEIQSHIVMAPVSSALLSFAGCCLKGWRDNWTGHASSMCEIVEFGHHVTGDIRDFLRGGVFSAPCYNNRMCNQWLFFRKRDYLFDGFELNRQSARHGWYRGFADGHVKARYWKCPWCPHPMLGTSKQDGHVKTRCWQ